MNQSIVHFEDVTYKLSSGKIILDQVNLTLPEHSSMTIIGHNGAGKSSLLKLLVADRFYQAGKIHLLGKKVDEHLSKGEIQKIRSQVGFIHQGLHLVGRKNALENVLMGRLTHNPSLLTWFGKFNSSDYDQAYESLKEVGMESKALIRADKLSGGERQKVAIARALAQSPKLLLADEPTAALDPRAAKSVANLLRSLVENKKVSLITVVHSLEISDIISERAVIMKQGRISFDGALSALSSNEISEFYNIQEEV